MQLADFQLVFYDSRDGMRNLGNLWTLTRAGRVLTCAVSTHVLGWELRVTIGDTFVRSAVCKRDAEVFETASAWRVAAIRKGWSASPTGDAD